ncbi:hypothetical protein HMPREF9371_1913 [Neisseria shayeganii 871]|uniref:Uncharacterized protein n=1 Tax=Neisseria shayeganii 871 TaxID=1032488 RepID=G4CJX3_9NEIS|nr:hypothetical protein HMPREF9371_1913 [Neisseria shayeganii 871]
MWSAFNIRRRFSGSLRPLRPHLQRFLRCALARLELHPHLEVL